MEVGAGGANPSRRASGTGGPTYLDGSAGAAGGADRGRGGVEVRRMDAPPPSPKTPSTGGQGGGPFDAGAGGGGYPREGASVASYQGAGYHLASSKEASSFPPATGVRNTPS